MPQPFSDIQKTKIYGQGSAGPVQSLLTMVAPLFESAIPGAYSVNYSSSKMAMNPVVGDERFGGRVVFDAPIDCTIEKYFIFQVGQLGFPWPGIYDYIDTLENGGVSIFIFDSAGSYSKYNIFGSEYSEASPIRGGWGAYSDPGSSGALSIFLDRARAPDDANGILNWSDTAGFELHVKFFGGSSASNAEVYNGALACKGVDLMLAGEPGNKSTFQGITDLTAEGDFYFQTPRAWQSTAGIFQGSVGLVREPIIDWRIGDGVTETHFECIDETMSSYPTRESSVAALPLAMLETYSVGIISQSAACTAEFNGVTWSCADIPGGAAAWICTGSNAATCAVINNSFVRYANISIGHAAFSSPVFDDVERIEITSDSVLTSARLRNCVGDGLIFSTPGDYSSITAHVESTTFGSAITIDSIGSGVFIVPGITVDSGHTINIHNSSATESITVQIQAGINYTTSTAGGSITIDFPEFQPTLTLTGLKNPSEVRVHDGTTELEIAGQENVIDGAFSALLPVGTLVVDISVITLDYENIYLLDVDTFTDRTIPIQQVSDRQYQNP